MAIIQPIIDLAEICALKGVKTAILCPGSRSAAITLAFVRNPKVNCLSVSDERSAGFIALGIALKTKAPVVIVCTSGSAVYNFSPAVVEAFFQHIPLIVITADRPQEWIHQNDGQTIYQQNIFGQNCKKSYNLLADFIHSDSHWFFQRSVNEAVSLSMLHPQGPVHLNIPIREPFYPTATEQFLPSANLQIIDYVEYNSTIDLEASYILVKEIFNNSKILIAIGQIPYNEQLNDLLDRFQNELNIPVLADVISNYQRAKVINHDYFLDLDNDNYRPDLLITIGQSFISKSFKKYFQKHKASIHWHIQEDTHIVDPLQNISKIITAEPSEFLKTIYEDIDNQQYKTGDDDFPSEYLNRFMGIEQEVEKRKVTFFNNTQEFSELQAYAICLQFLPSQCDLHLANSMAVRYANLLRFDENKSIEVFANRGTSGIDGCLSTALGAALHSDHLVYLFIGDMAFLYDRNGLWNNFIPKNLRIIVFNNAGGGIFRLIDGPSKQPELEVFFETKQRQSAEATVIEADLKYYKASDLITLKDQLLDFNSNDGQSKCLEIFSSATINQKTFTTFMNLVKNL
jgi:2-succinyl-5-enolpyruvyl-6-hydroxy-3-cyclohexene-1-carboxylate synthase